jgi:hypothetical protein
MAIMTLTGSDELELFYKKPFWFSYSSINKLLFSPRMFYSHYVLNQRQDSTDAHLVAGRVLHCLLFEPDTFDKQFILLPGKLPSGNNKQVIDNIFKYHCTLGNDSLNLDDYSPEILNQLLTINLHQSLKTDEQRLAKILTEEHKDYFTFLKTSLDKTIVDEVTLNGCKESLIELKSNQAVRALLQLDKTPNDVHIKTFSEHMISVNQEHLPFGYKGILDNVVMDYDSKTLFINDLKTTGKDIASFPDSVSYYKYWIQAAIYHKLAWNNFIKPLSDAVEWEIVITFIVIDKYNQVYPYQVSKETLEIWLADFEDIEDKLRYHYDNREYKLPYELALGNVKL